MRLKTKILSNLLLITTLIGNFPVNSFAYENTQEYSSSLATINSNFTITIPKTLALAGSGDDFSVGNYTIDINGDIEDDEVLIVKPDDNFYLSSVGKDDVLAEINQENTRWYNTQLKNTTSGNINAKLSAGLWNGTFNFDISVEKDEEAFKYTTLSFNPDKLVITKNLEETVDVSFNGKDVTSFVNFKADNDIVSVTGNTFKGLKEGTASIEVSYDLRNEEGFNKNKTVTSILEVEVIPCEHNFKLINTTDATCILDSDEDYECEICGELKTEHSTPATGHTPKEAEEIENIKPTCTEEGKITTAIYCEVCNEQISNETQIIPATGHNFGDEQIEQAATCTEDGVKKSTCSICGETKTEVISRTGHTPGDFETVVEPTCINSGLEQEKCTVCGAITKENEIPALGHDLDEIIVEPTCEKEGTKTTYCKRCDYEETEKLPVSEHTLGDFVVINAPTCTESGLEEQRCTVCGKLIQSSTIPALGHTPGEMVIENEVAATCTEDGSFDEVVRCEVCNEILSSTTKTVEKFGHSQSDPVEENRVEPTCTEDGSFETVVYCNLCGEELIREENTIPNTGHDYVLTETIETSCVKDGQKVFTCSKCGDVQKETLPATGHVYVLTDLVVDVPSTCAKEGSQSVHCKVCGETIEGTVQKLDKLPHTFTTYVSNNDATCTKDGTKTAVCDVCGDAYDIITDENTKLNHPYTEEIVEPTCIAQGYTKYTCDVCGDSVDNILPALGHNFVNGTCTRCGKFDISKLDAGLYDENYNITKSWDELLEEGTVHVDEQGNFTTNIVYLDNGNTTDKNDSNDAISGTLIIPNTVSTLKSGSLAYLHNLKAVYIPDTVTTIENGTFNSNSSLEAININEDNTHFTVEDDILFNKDKTTLISCPPLHEGDVYEIPDTVKTIYNGAFSSANINYILVPSGIESIGATSFRGSKIKSMDLSACTNLKQIGVMRDFNVMPTYYYFGTFGDCTELSSIKLPESLQVIGDGLFKNCTNLTSINIPSGVTKIGRHAFENVPAELNIDLTNLKAIGSYAFAKSGIQSIKTYETFSELEYDSVFAGSSLKLADFSQSTNLVKVGASNLETGKSGSLDGIFQGCKELTSLKLSPSTKILGDNVLNGCTNLTEITGLDSVELVGRSGIRDTGDIGDIYMPSIKTIGLYCFQNSKLTSFTSGSELEEIEFSSAFRACPNLKTVDIENSKITKLDNSHYKVDSSTGTYYGSFQNCTALETVKLPETLTYIGDTTFGNCTSLTNINVPENIEFLGRNTFQNVPAALDLNLPNIEYIGSGALGTSKIVSLTTGQNFKEFEGATEFIDNKTLKTVDLSKSTNLKSLGGSTRIGLDSPDGSYKSLFVRCTSLESVALPEGLESIGCDVFRGCSALTTINVPITLRQIGRKAFYGVPAEMIANLPNVEAIGAHAFQGAKLTMLVTGPELVTLENYAFNNCTSLVKADLSASTKLTTLGDTYLGTTTDSIYSGEFQGDYILEEVLLPDSIKVIGDSAFKNCAKLTNITLPSNLEVIGKNAFFNASLANVTIPASVNTIGYAAICGSGTVALLKTATFENPNGWFVTTTKEGTSGTNLTLTDSAANATYLENTYANYYWYRK